MKTKSFVLLTRCTPTLGPRRASLPQRPPTNCSSARRANELTLRRELAARREIRSENPRKERPQETAVFRLFRQPISTSCRPPRDLPGDLRGETQNLQGDPRNGEYTKDISRRKRPVRA